MDASMFVLPESGDLVEMRREGYLTEEDLQALLARYPALIRSAATGGSRRWLLVRREAALPDDEGAGDRWAMDHLFLDQDAVPTLVEVKRSTDTRIRREVVGQMLDYAANAVLFLSPERMRGWFEERCTMEGLDPGATLGAITGPEVVADDFWAQVKTNLQAGRIRLLFVADIIPRELQRIIEFLNGQMDPAEVLGVEVQQFVGEHMRTLVPHVVGQTAGAEQAKASSRSARGHWDEASFFADLEARRGEAETAVARNLFDWGRRAMPRISWGVGAQTGSFAPVLDRDGVGHSILIVYSSGYLQIPLGYMESRPPFTDATLRSDLVSRLAAAGFPLPKDTGWPSIRLSALTDATALTRFMGVLDWAVDVITQSPAQGA